MRLAARSADELLTEARAEAERVTAAARAEADRILSDARAEAERLLVSLDETRARIREDVALMQQARLARRNELRVQEATWLAEEAAVEVG
jgi:cell division septum initiation protein DivIVA